jgi:hypothetical protein
MSNLKSQTSAETIEMENLDLLLGELEIEETETVEAETVAEPEEITGNLDEETVRVLETELAKKEVYEAAGEPSADVIESYDNSEFNGARFEPAAAVPVAGTPMKLKRAKREKKAATTTEKKEKIERNVNALPPEAFQLVEEIPADAAHKAIMIAKRPSQKKIGEKFDQMICALHAGRKPSVYIMDLFAILDEKKTVTSLELIAALKAKSRTDGTKTYDDGTARSQVGQIMVLFHVLNIASRANQTLHLVENSTFARKLRDVSRA